MACDLFFWALELTIWLVLFAIIHVLKELRKIESKVEKLNWLLVHTSYLPINNNENAWDSD